MAHTDGSSDLVTLLAQIAKAATRAGSPAGKALKRVRKMPARAVQLSEICPLPDEIDQLYRNFDGVQAEKAKLNQWQSNLFLDFDFWTSGELFFANRGSRRRDYKPRRQSVVVSSSIMQLGLNLAVGSEHPDAPSGVYASRYPMHERDYLAFDTVEGWLRTSLDAWEEGAMTIGDKGRLTYDPAQIAAIAARHNAAREYWDHLAAGDVDWGPSNLAEWEAVERQG
ncbi:hypothetical protein [Pseudooceanicola sp. MF1-13]|uniref:hypothetical protein n=1 Tax=Pseudooceanicola sp. MF1-13 TaxID=3379095 RepID=UPI0038925B7A